MKEIQYDPPERLDTVRHDKRLADFTAVCYNGSVFHLTERRGELIYNKVGSVTPEPLKALYKEATKRP